MLTLVFILNFSKCSVEVENNLENFAFSFNELNYPKL